MQNTNEFLNTAHQRIERILEKAISEWQLLPSEKLETSPAPGAWSAAQCLEHLNIYGRHYLPAIEKAMESAKKQGSQPASQVQSGWLGAWFTNLMLPQPDGHLKKRMNSPKNAVPSANPDARTMLAEFIDQQEKMLALLATASEVNLNTVRVPTSLSPLIRMRLGDTFAFVIAHLERHVLQATKASLHAH
jgi:hypothetical protein